MQSVFSQSGGKWLHARWSAEDSILTSAPKELQILGLFARRSTSPHGEAYGRVETPRGRRTAFL